jgi:hypothetical protein
MNIAFTCWVTPSTLRWHIRFFAPQFIDCLKQTPRVKGADLTFRLAVFGLEDSAMEIVREAWKDSPIPVIFVQESIEGIRRHQVMYRPYNRIAALHEMDSGIHDYIISLSPTTTFRDDAVRDYLDSAVQMQGMPEAGAVVHMRAAPANSSAGRNALHQRQTWGLRCHEGVTFRNVGRHNFAYNFFIHRSMELKDKYYLEDICILYGLMMEGYGLYTRHYHQAMTYDPVFHTLAPPHLTNPFGRMRGDNWDSKLNNGWAGARDKEFLGQFLEVNWWLQDWDYIKNCWFKTGFLGQFRKKNEALKKQ